MAHPGHKSTLTLALLKSFPKDLLKIGSAAHGIYIRTGKRGFTGNAAPKSHFCIRHTENRLRDLPGKLIPSPDRFGFAIKIQGAPPQQMNRMVTTGHRVKKKIIREMSPIVFWSCSPLTPPLGKGSFCYFLL